MNGAGLTYADYLIAEATNDLENEIENKNKEIERLNNIINEYKNANEYHQNIIHELETMKQPNQLHSENVRLRAENNRLTNIINEFNDSYCKIITKCNEMIKDRMYLNEYAIKRYAEEIKEITKYYVEEANWYDGR